jgi:hypothetical protein
MKFQIKKTKPILPIISIFLFIGFFLGCSDPISDKEKEDTVKILVERTLLPGTHIRFWDGTDENEKTVPAGNYFVMLYTQEFTYPLYRITALAGGTGKSNESPTQYIPNSPPITGIEKADPDTFYVEDGTNIYFTLAEETGVRLTIRNRE